MILQSLKICFFIAMLIVSTSFGNDKVSIITWPDDLITRHTNAPSLSIANDFAEEFFNFLGKGKKSKIINKPMNRDKMLKEMAAGTVDLVIPGTILRGIKYCVDYNYIPWGMVVPSIDLTNKFCEYIAISRNGEINSIENLKNTTWCVAGKYADVDFYLTCLKLKQLLKSTNLCEFINLYHIYENEIGFMIPGRRHSVIQSVLIHEADWAIVPEYDYQSYIELFPAISNKLKEVKWLNTKVRLPGYFVICKKSSFAKLEEYWKAGLKMHTTAAGNQFIISSGFERFCPVPDTEFQQLTNWYKYLPESDKFVF